jgi:hypothetical protein
MRYNHVAKDMQDGAGFCELLNTDVLRSAALVEELLHAVSRSVGGGVEVR